MRGRVAVGANFFMRKPHEKPELFERIARLFVVPVS